jgi:hypothetical protein
MTIGEPAVEAGRELPARGESADPQGIAPPPHARLGALEELGERIAELAAQISAATYELLVMLRDFDERGGWNSGFHSCAHWLVWRVGLDLGAAREKMRVARALAALPQLSEAMRCGEISYSKVRALTRIATPDNECDLLSFARAGTAAHVERLVRGMRRVDRIAAGDDEQRRHAARYLRAYTDEDGMVVVTGRLAPEAGAALLRALDAGVEKLYGPRRGQPSGGGAPEPADEPMDEVSAEQRRADALGLVAESALAAGLDPGSRGNRYQSGGARGCRGAAGWRRGRLLLAGGRFPRFRGNVPAPGLRLRPGGDAARRGRPRARRWPPHARHLTRPPPRPRSSRRRLPLPGLRQEALRRPSRRALGRRWRDQPF